MQYIRVMPRDFFNEAILLKCLGQLTLLLHEQKIQAINPNLEINWYLEPDTGFNIELHPFNYLYCSNFFLTINGEYLAFLSHYNRTGYPLVCEYNNDWIEVFDTVGNISEDFKQFLQLFDS